MSGSSSQFIFRHLAAVRPNQPQINRNTIYTHIYTVPYNRHKNKQAIVMCSHNEYAIGRQYRGILSPCTLPVDLTIRKFRPVSRKIIGGFLIYKVHNSRVLKYITTSYSLHVCLRTRHFQVCLCFCRNKLKICENG